MSEPEPEEFVADVTFKELFVGMNLAVFFDLNTVSELFATVLAFERLLAGMSSPMSC